MQVDDLTQTIQDVATRIGPAVVAVGRGAGTVVASGHVLTNAHNVPTDDPVHVRFADGSVASGEVTASDADGDLAIVAVDTGEITPPTWADAPPTIGTAVLALATTRTAGPR